MPDIFDSYSHQLPDVNPIIYAYSDTRWPGYLKIGYTTRTIDERMREHYPTLTPTISYKVEYVEPALYSDGTTFMDHDVHKVLRKKGVKVIKTQENGKTTEWYKCTVNEVKAAVLAVKTHTLNEENRTETFGMRPEQVTAVDMTEAYFKKAKKDDPNHTAKFLWNCKMRFGKTFTSYELAKRMGLKNILILTFKPAVEDSWETDLLTHIDFEGWQFYSRKTEIETGLTPDDLDKKRPIVCFGSFQDYLGTNAAGGIKAKNEWVHTTNWDLVIFDEYHFGAWRDNAKKLFDKENEDAYDSMDMEKYAQEEAFNAYNESFLPITTNYYLFLSGTPFRAINNGEFLEDQIYSWTYSDEQKAKAEWPNLSMFPNYKPKDGETNPYAELPRMVMMTYKMPAELERVAKNSDNDEFDLNVFFSAKTDTDSNEDAYFVYSDEVQKWLNMIRGSYMPMAIDDLKLNKGDRPVMPFSDRRMLNTLTHTLWFMPNVISCYAMRNLLAEKQNTFWHDYKVNLCAGASAGIGLDAVEPVRDSMDPALDTKTITLSCGKLTTGITIRPWTGILMLRNLSSPETYFQAAFRVQSPWTMTKEDNTKQIIKQDCYVFDFAVNRCLRQISDYSRKLNINEPDEEKKVGEFIRFLPVLAFDGSVMAPIDAGQILDIVTAGTSATLLARKWQSSLLVNVDNDTLQKIMDNKELLDALLNIEDFRNLRDDINIIINKSEHVKKAKKEGETPLTKKEKEELTQEEKDYRSRRKKIQDNLKKIASRLPIFMYLTDYREHSLKDVITKLEPELFQKATGLSVKTFEQMVSIGAFNESLMNDAVVQFRRYEAASLEYAGIAKHDPHEDIGLFSTVISKEDFDELAKQQQLSTNPVQTIVNSVVKPGSMTRSHAKKAAEAPKNSDTEQTKLFEATFGKIVSDFKPAVIPANAKTVTPAVAKFDSKKVKVGTDVIHKVFGEGKVTRFVDNKVIVRFAVIGEKTFIMPMAFEKGFLTLKGGN